MKASITFQTATQTAVHLFLLYGAVDAFQTPRLARSTTTLQIRSYQNRTDTVLEAPANVAQNLETNYNWETGDEVTDDHFVKSYFEDGTPYHELTPTLDRLKAWTLEYAETVDLAGGITRPSAGVQNLMANEFVFTSPTIGPVNKNDFVSLMEYYSDCGFDLASAVPDLTVTYEGWHQDPHEPWRVWAVARYSGTHTGTATVPDSGLRLTPPNDGSRSPKFVSGPEMHSFLWTADKKLLWQTMGFVGDSYTGTNQGHGGLDGLLVSMGLPHLYVEATNPMRNVKSWFAQFRETERAKTRSAYSYLPQWWHERKSYDLNVHK